VEDIGFINIFVLWEIYDWEGYWNEDVGLIRCRVLTC